MRFVFDNHFGAGIQFPDATTFAFMPNFVEVTGLNGQVDDLTISVTAGQSSRSIDVPVFGSNTKVDVSHLLQGFFGDMRNAWASSMRVVSGQMIVVAAGITLASVPYNCYWGAIEPLERVGQFGTMRYDADSKIFRRTVRYFKNYPFSLESIAGDAQGYKVANDGGEYGEETALASGAIAAIPSNKLQGVYFSDVLIQPQSDANVWDDTFDHTFANIIPTSRQVLRVNIDERKEGYYLRWIDAQGLIAYYLFAEGTDSNKTTDNGTMPQAIEQGGMAYNFGARVFGKTRTKSKKICANLVPEQEQELVTSIGTAIICDLYAGKDEQGRDLWLPVIPKAGTLSVRENKGLQDIEIEVQIPCAEIQRL